MTKAKKGNFSNQKRYLLIRPFYILICYLCRNSGTKCAQRHLNTIIKCTTFIIQRKSEKERKRERVEMRKVRSIWYAYMYVLPSRKIQIIKIFNMHKAFRSITNVFIDTIILILAVCVCALVSFGLILFIVFSCDPRY